MFGRITRHPRPAFSPSVHQPPLARLVTGIERRVKGVLFGCRMCGNCLLLETAFTCPMTCPNGLRNGPCLDSIPDHCAADFVTNCTWLRICQRAEQRGSLERLLEVYAPLDDRRVGCETILSAYQLWRRRKQGPRLRDLITNRARFRADWEAFRYVLRQPDWWQGDSRYHPPAYTEPTSWLEEMLRSGRFVVSAGVAAPQEPAADSIAQMVGCLQGYVDAISFTGDLQGTLSMCGLACAVYSLQNGLEPVLPLQSRYRSRYAVESEAVGAAAAGVRNILCLSDGIGRSDFGPPPSPELNDLDTVQALWMLRRLRDEGVNVDGEVIERRPCYFLGAVAAPCTAWPHYEALVTEKKINAGAQFLQTLPVFDLPRFVGWLEALDKRNVLGKAYLIPTVMLLESPRHAHFMANEAPGIHIPPTLLARMEGAADPREEGVQIALGIIAELKGMAGVHGLHILAPDQEDMVPRLVRESGLRGFASSIGVFSENGRNKSRPGQAAGLDVLP